MMIDIEVLLQMITLDTDGEEVLLHGTVNQAHHPATLQLISLYHSDSRTFLIAKFSLWTKWTGMQIKY